MAASPLGVGGTGDGFHIAVAVLHGAVTIFDALDGYKILTTFQTTEEQISAMKYSPNARLLACGSNENSVHVFDAARGYRIHCKCVGHTTYITALDWSVDSDVLRTNCAANEVLFWDVLRRGSGNQIRERHSTA